MEKMKLEFIELARKLQHLQTIEPDLVALSKPGHDENPEDGYDNEIMDLNIVINGVRLGGYLINTEAKMKNVQNLKFGDNLAVRRNDKKFAFDCGWRILENVCIRQATPEKRGLHWLLIATWGLQTIEREIGDPTVHHTVMRKMYKYTIPGTRGVCVYKLRSGSWRNKS
jgi:hypothetical protein